jgi:hypothetical protein
MAVAAFDGNNSGGYRKVMAMQRWRLTSAVAGGDDWRQHLMVAMDKGGRWRMLGVMDSSCVSGGQ